MNEVETREIPESAGDARAESIARGRDDDQYRSPQRRSGQSAAEPGTSADEAEASPQVAEALPDACALNATGPTYTPITARFRNGDGSTSSDLHADPRPAHAVRRSPDHDAAWLHDARRARLLSWISLAWMGVEGGVGLIAGLIAGSVALEGFGLSSGVEGMASAIVIWRFTGSRIHSDSSEHGAHKAVAISFWILAPYIAIQSVFDLVTQHHAGQSPVGIAVAATSLLLMPVLGRAKQRLGARLGSAATQGEGAQNMLCAAMAAAVLVGLAGQALFGAWWLDPLAGLFIATVAVMSGLAAWRGDGCADCAPVGFESPGNACDDSCPH